MCSSNSSEIFQKQQDQLGQFVYFPSTVYTIKKPEFVKDVNAVAVDNIQKQNKKLDALYPVHMTDNLFFDPRMHDFAAYVGSTAWDILNSQGYAMNGLGTYFTELWCQEHHKHSSMEQHVHGFGVQLIGFYFLETPKNCSRLVIHDPRAGKVQSALPEQNINQATYASNAINFAPEVGQLVITNSWLPHSFSKNGATKPMRFIHFNIGVRTSTPAPNQCSIPPAAEVI